MTAVDFSEQMLDYARQRPDDWAADHTSQNSIKWIEGDALRLPCGAEQFDAATVGYGLRNVDNIPKALSELHRVLKPGAKGAVLDFNNSSSRVVDQLQSWALQSIVVPLAASYGLSQEYAYLQPSIQKFPKGEVLTQAAPGASASFALPAFSANRDLQ